MGTGHLGIGLIATLFGLPPCWKGAFGIACLLCRVWLSAIALAGFVYFSHPIRIAVAIAVATLLFARGKVIVPGERMFLAILCNVHALLLVANLAGAHGWVFHIYPAERVIAIEAALLPAMTLSILVSDIWFEKSTSWGHDDGLPTLEELPAFSLSHFARWPEWFIDNTSPSAAWYRLSDAGRVAC